MALRICGEEEDRLIAGPDKFGAALNEAASKPRWTPERGAARLCSQSRRAVRSGMGRRHAAGPRTRPAEAQRVALKLTGR